MGQTAMSGEVNMENLDVNNSLEVPTEQISLTCSNSKDKLTNDQEITISREVKPEDEDIQGLEIYLSASNFLMDLNKEFETEDLVNVEFSIAKEETQEAKSFQEQFEGIKISEISCEDIAVNTDITQNQILKSETIPHSQDQNDPFCGCLSSKNMVDVLKKEILKDMALFRPETVNSDTLSTFFNPIVDEGNSTQFQYLVTSKKSCTKICFENSKNQNGSSYLDDSLENEVNLVNMRDDCSSLCTNHGEQNRVNKFFGQIIRK